MSFFSRSLYGADPSFTPLFRLLDDFDTYSREAQGNQPENGRNRRHHARTFNPKFDVRETENTYELHGELAGIERENLHIEFTEPQTIVIRGRVERTYTAGTPPAGLIEGSDTQMSGAITEGGESQHQTHKVTVEDEEAEKAKEQKGTPAGTTSGAQVAKKGKDNQQQQHQQQPKEKFWVSERSVGEFSRTFSFPSRVDQEGVSANLNNGILSITIPKAKKVETRRIAIN